MRLPFILITLIGATLALKKLQLKFESVSCFVDPVYGSCSWTLLNTSHFDATFILKLPVSGLLLQAHISQVEGNKRATTIFNKKYDFCAGNEDFLSHYMVLYVGRIINAFFEGRKLKCPLVAGDYSAKTMSFSTDLIPLQLFYKPKSHFVTNITLFDVVNDEQKTFTIISLKCKIGR